MKNKILFGLLAVFTVLSAVRCDFFTRKCPPCPPSGCCIDFDTAPFVAGTTYSTVGAPVAAVCDFDVTIDNLISGGTPYFNFGKVEPATSTFGSGNVFNTNNVTLKFKNTKAGTSTVTMEYQDMGGTANLSVNGILFSGKLNAAPASLGGVSVSVFTTSITGGQNGFIKLKGVIKDFSIGGQEFHLDDICRR